MVVSVLICTYNRQALLARTLDGLAAMTVGGDITWEVIVVDNNCTDGTAAEIGRRARGFPVPLRRVVERQQGKAHALNAGLGASSAKVVAFTDDDVRIPAGWLDAAVRPLLSRDDVGYTGGPVAPWWEVAPPDWLDGGDPGVLWGPIAILDYGPEEFVFEDRRRIPMGVNMAVRRDLIEQAGGFHPGLERKGASLMGQGQAEFFFRTRRLGVRGLYVPAMRLQHHVPAARLTREYFRRWWFWKGVARARMQALHPVSENGLDLRDVPRLAGLPRFLWGSALRDTGGWIRAALRRDPVARSEREMMLAFFAGYFMDTLQKGRL